MRHSRLRRKSKRKSQFLESPAGLTNCCETRKVQMQDMPLKILSKNVKSNRPEVFSKRGVLRNFAKFKGKHLCQSLFFIKVAGLRPATLLKKRIWHRCFPMNFSKFLRIPFLTEHLWWLLLKCQSQNVS